MSKPKEEVLPIQEEVKTIVEATEEVLPTLESIVLDTEAKQQYMRDILSYKASNPVKFASKEKELIKKLLNK
jgi:hypothetical protein